MADEDGLVELLGGVGMTPQPAPELTVAEVLEGYTFDPEQITTMLRKVDGDCVQPIIRKAAESLYEAVLNTAHDYLLENLDHNLKNDLAYLRAANAEMRRQLYAISVALGRPHDYDGAVAEIASIQQRLSSDLTRIFVLEGEIAATKARSEGEGVSS